MEYYKTETDNLISTNNELLNQVKALSPYKVCAYVCMRMSASAD